MKIQCAILAAALAGSGAITGRAADRANILVILADDLGYGEAGCYGGRDIPTPHIDSLAENGVRFASGYVTAPFCAASRASLLTGRYQTRFGFEFNPIGARNADPQIGLPPGERTLAEALREAGYATALVGKWHLGATARFHPQRRGFDEFFGFLHEGHYYAPPPWAGHVTWLRRRTLPDGSEGRWTSPDGRVVWSTKQGTFEPSYDADNPVLRNSLPVAEPSNLTDAFTRELTSSNGPLRGEKGQLLEGGVRVPFLAQWKGRIPGGGVESRVVSSLDIFPTALAAAGADAHPARELDGVNLLPFLTGENPAAPHDALYWRYGQQAAIRAGDWKLVKTGGPKRRPPGKGDPPASMEGAELYNLAADIGETNNLAAGEPERVKQLAAAWDRWNLHNIEPAWVPEPAVPAAKPKADQ